jgi:hypothetical protein
MFAEETTSVASDRRVFSAGEHTGGLEHVVAGEQERTEHLARLGGVDVGAADIMFSSTERLTSRFSCSCA